MLLRASSQRDGASADLGSVTRDSGASGVEHGDWLRALVEATLRGEWQRLAELRRAAGRAIGAQQTVDVLTVAAAFNGITRVADAIGIPLDPNTADTTQALREVTGIERFAYARKSARYD
jgi:uncharacterized protein YunC (DUF1805 family)